MVAEALGCFFVFNRTFLILDLSDFSPLLIRFRLCSPGQKNYISDAVSPWCQIWRWMMSSCPLWVIFDHLFGQNVWLIFFFFYPLELTDLWGDILGLCKCPTVHQNFTLGFTCTGDWFLPEPVFSVVVIKMVVFQLRSPSPFTLLSWYGVMGSWFSLWFIIYYWPVLSPILYLYILFSTVRALVPSIVKNI